MYTDLFLIGDQVINMLETPSQVRKAVNNKKHKQN